MGRQRDRTFTGCWKCRERKVKCDEGKPSCRACLRIGVECSGYGPKLTWVPGDSQVPKSVAGRRLMESESTWKGFNVLPSELLDVLILQTDGEQPETKEGRNNFEPSCHNPFSVFPGTVKAALSNICASQALGSSGALSFNPDLNPTERFLFHHYVGHVASLMMPYKHARNPWRFYYPVTALDQVSIGQKALFHAMLAQSAFNLSLIQQPGGKMRYVGMKHHSSAIQHLQSLVLKDSRDVNVVIAAIMTMLFSELYSGDSRTWRYHLNGAWSFLRKYHDSAPWNMSDLACASLQSLNIVCIIGATSTSRVYDGLNLTNCSLSIDSNLFRTMCSTPGFGLTIGAMPSILDCISDITAHIREEQPAEATQDVVVKVLAKLNEARDLLENAAASEGSSGPDQQQSSSAPNSDPYRMEMRSPASRLQSQAFVNATYVYLYRMLLNVPPHCVQAFVASTFEKISAYYEISEGNLSIWPAFIAAVEAYTERDQAQARQWLDHSVSYGMGNRLVLRRLVEEIWRRRQEAALKQGIDQGEVSMDWRALMEELDADVLLL